MLFIFRSKGLFCVSFLVFFILLAVSSPAAIFNVTNEMELRDALDTAENNGEDDTINIEGGTYNTGGMTFTYLPAVTENFSLTIVGQGEGLTILDGNNLGGVLNIDTSDVGDDSNTDINISDLTIQNGFSAEDGGGIFVVAGDNLLEADDPVVTIEHCSFINNTATDNGGGVCVRSAFINLNNNTFTNNSANEGGGSDTGGGGSTVTLTNNIYTNNSAIDEGGGASVGGGGLNATLTNNEFTDNAALEGGGADIGGGGAMATLTHNRFIENSAIEDGGGASISGGGLVAVLTNNIFLGNMASGNGGGSEIRGGGITATLTHNTLTLNSVLGVGGGFNIVLLQGTELANIFNNIVFNNSATGNGDDIFVDDDVDADLIGSTVNLSNNDFSDFHSQCENTGGCVSNIMSANNIDADPLFVNAVAGDVGITAGSPVIDAGDPFAPALPANDILGSPRIIGPAPDMGAVEFTGVDPFDPADANQDGMVSAADITCVILGIFGMPCPMPDCNQDGMVTAADITCVILAIFN